ncbi:MAG: UbiX family flavin prenyltransferase [Nitrospinae bacterium]|nr:UbiX family flavin prenyltransferase [Nitrospinota bacterium]
MKKIILAITGASGAIYARHLFDFLQRKGVELHLIITENAKGILKDETSIGENYFKKKNVSIYENSNMNVRIASGSFRFDSMVIIPASMGTIGRIASGYSDDLVSRAADVALKERKKLIIVPRETPLNDIHLNNMLTLSRAGAVILPASPAFYHKPKDINDMAKFIVSRVLDQLGIENDLVPTYGEKT